MSFRYRTLVVEVCVVVLALLCACGPSLPSDLPGLMHLMGSNDMRVNFAAARRVREVYGKEGLLTALQQPDANTRAVAAHFLMHYQGADVQTALLGATGDADTFVRMWAAFSLGKVGDQNARKRLRELESDPASEVSREARKALEELEQRLSSPSDGK